MAHIQVSFQRPCFHLLVFKLPKELHDKSLKYYPIEKTENPLGWKSLDYKGTLDSNSVGSGFAAGGRGKSFGQGALYVVLKSQGNPREPSALQPRTPTIMCHLGGNVPSVPLGTVRPPTKALVGRQFFDLIPSQEVKAPLQGSLPLFCSW